MWENGGLNGWGADCSVSQIGELPFRVKSGTGKGSLRNLECVWQVIEVDAVMPGHWKYFWNWQ